MTDLISVDIETTGLDPTRHEAWEIALVRVPDTDDPDFTPFECCFHMPVTLIGAESKALEVGDFKRYEYPVADTAIDITKDTTVSSPVGNVTALLYDTLKGNRLMGMSVHFDAAFLEELFRRRGWEPAPWHHRYLDLGSFAGGAWGYGQPMSSSTLQEHHIPNAHPHTALGDARWNVAVWNAIVEKQLEAG